MKIRLKDIVFCLGVMMFLFGLLSLDSNLTIGAILSLSGLAIGFIGEKFLF